MSVQKFYNRRFGGMEINEEKKRVTVMFPGHEENMIISLEKWKSGNSIKCPTGTRNIWEEDIKQTKTEVFWRNGEAVIPLNDFERQGEEAYEVSKLIIGKNSLSISLFTFQKEWSVLHNEHFLTVLPDTHTLTYLKMQMVVKFLSGSSDKIIVEGIGLVQQDNM